MIKLPTRISELVLTESELKSPLWVKLQAALEGERDALRADNDAMSDIAKTTWRRGEIACVKKILALSDEVGPEKRASEAMSPESHITGHVAGIPVEN